MKQLFIPTLLLFALFATSCSTAQSMINTTTFDPEADRKELTSATWTFDRVLGTTIDKATDGNQPYLKFTTDGKVMGNTGCNPINGTYTLEKGLRIKFNNVATGLALCEDFPYERDLLQILNSTDNYTLTGGTLSLNKGRMAPMGVLSKKDDASAGNKTDYLLSSHVLDITEGLPASGVTIKLERHNPANNSWTTVAEKVTNDKGRINDFLPMATAELGTYRFTFYVEDYFKRKQTETFYPFIEVVFRIDERKHYHVPITLSAFGYSTYRGS